MMRIHRILALALSMAACSGDDPEGMGAPDLMMMVDAAMAEMGAGPASDSGAEPVPDIGAGPVADTGPGPVEDGAVVAADMGTVDPVRPQCTADTLAACRYVPNRPRTALGTTRGPFEISYMDVTGGMRTFSYEVRIPEGAGAATPIIIWSHGGASGKDDPSRVATDFGRIAVEAGYTMVAIAHHPRPFETYESLCRSIGQNQAQCRAAACQNSDECSDFEGGVCADGFCRYFKPLNWDRPHDFRALMDALTAPDAPVVGDTSKVVYAGHSAGAGSTMMVAGAVRQYGDSVHLLHDPRPMAFISGSPQGVGDDGFIAQSYPGEGCRSLAADPAHCLTRPHLIMTGAGDDTTGHTGEDRRDAYAQLPDGDKYLIWNTEEAGRHTVFEFKPDSCERYDGPGAVDSERCQAYVTWLESAAIAFLDAYTRDGAAARAYLASDHLVTLSGGAVEWGAK